MEATGDHDQEVLEGLVLEVVMVDPYHLEAAGDHEQEVVMVGLYHLEATEDHDQEVLEGLFLMVVMAVHGLEGFKAVP